MRVRAADGSLLVLEAVGGELGRLGVDVDGVTRRRADADVRSACGAEVEALERAAWRRRSPWRAASAEWKSTSLRW